MSTMEEFGLPAGRYPATLEGVSLGGHRRYNLMLKAKVTRNGVTVIESHPMGEDDPYRLSPSQRKILHETARRLNVQDSGPAEEIVAALDALKGAEVTAYVREGPMGMLCTFSRNGGEEEAVSGEVLDRMPEAEPEYTQRTIDAQSAHEMLLTGLHHANRGFALVAQACWKLRQDEGWTALGYNSVSAYLADPEVSMSRSTFYGFADIWDQYIERGGQDEKLLAHPSKLEVPIPALKAGDVDAEEAIHDVQVLGLRDLRIKYRGEKDTTGERVAKAEFPFGCAHCGSLLQSHDDIRKAA